jgi:hypothetical protein
VELHLVYIAEESASELHPADLESGAPVVLLQFPSVAEQFQGYLDCSGREVKTFSVLFSWRFLVVEPSSARAFHLFESYLDA